MRNIYTAIDLGSDSIKIVTGEILNSKFNVLASTAIRSSGIRRGDITDIGLATKSLKEALNEIESAIGTSIDEAILCIPASNNKLKIVSGNTKVLNEEGIITGEEVINVLQDAVLEKVPSEEELINIIPVTFTIDDEVEVRDPKGKTGEYLSVKTVISTAPKKDIYKYIQVLNNCNIDATDVTLGSIGDYYEVLNNDTNKTLGAVINIGSEKMDISLFNKGIIIKQGVIELGSKNIDKDISYIYGVDLPTSRTLKENFSVCSRRYADTNDVIEIETKSGEKVVINQYEISEIIESRVVELLKLAKKQINSLTKRKISYIIVTGGITELTGFSYVVENTLGINANTLNMVTIGVRDNKYSTSSGAIKYFHDKLVLREKNYSMFESNKIEQMINNTRKINKTTNDTIVSRVFGYFTGN